MPLPTVLFIDECCPKPYDSGTLYTQAQGGTESTVTRIAEGIQATGLFNVFVEQHNRTAAKGIFVPPGACESADYVVCLRLPESLNQARPRFPQAKLYLWAHDLYSPDHALVTVGAFEATKARALICVSDFHKQQIIRALQEAQTRLPAAAYVSYPPVDISIAHDDTPYDPNQLAWFSSPHKGLKEALDIFKVLYSQDPSMRLVVHNPGYFSDYAGSVPPGVVLKAQGSYYDSIKTVKESLCVFYPNMVFPETFGLVFAEANTVGTPVLTHDIGAAREVLDHPHEVMQCHDTQAVVNRVLGWKAGLRPTVRGNARFKLGKVVRQWIRDILS